MLLAGRPTRGKMSVRRMARNVLTKESSQREENRTAVFKEDSRNKGNSQFCFQSHSLSAPSSHCLKVSPLILHIPSKASTNICWLPHLAKNEKIKKSHPETFKKKKKIKAWIYPHIELFIFSTHELKISYHHHH